MYILFIANKVRHNASVRDKYKVKTSQTDRERLKSLGGKDKPKFELNPRPAPGSSDSKLPGTRQIVVQEKSLGDLSLPLGRDFSDNFHN